MDSPPPIPSLFSCLFPRRPLIKPAVRPSNSFSRSSALIDFQEAKPAGRSSTGRAAWRSWPAQRGLSPGGEDGRRDGRVDGWMNLPPISYQQEQLLGGRAGVNSPSNTHTHTPDHNLPLSSCPLFLCLALLFCWGDNTHREGNLCPRYSHQ